MNNAREFILYFIFIAVVLFFGFSKVGKIAVECKNNFVKKNRQVNVVKDLKIKVDTIASANAKLEKQKDILRPFFKQDFAPDDSIASFGGMFEDIVSYVKMNGLLLRSIEYNINPEEDQIYQNFTSTYNVCQVKLYMVGTYPQLQKFLNDIYTYPYYTSIDSISLNPYEYNKKFLVAEIDINLYSKK